MPSPYEIKKTSRFLGIRRAALILKSNVFAVWSKGGVLCKELGVIDENNGSSEATEFV